MSSLARKYALLLPSLPCPGSSVFLDSFFCSTCRKVINTASLYNMVLGKKVDYVKTGIKRLIFKQN